MIGLITFKAMQQDRASELFAEAMPPARREVLLQSLAASRRLCTATPQPPVPFAACLHRLPRVSRGLNVVYCYRYQRVQEEKRKKKNWKSSCEAELTACHPWF